MRKLSLYASDGGTATNNAAIVATTEPKGYKVHWDFDDYDDRVCKILL